MTMLERFNIAGYCRISVDEELDRDNVSIENQEKICQGGISPSEAPPIKKNLSIFF